MKLAATPIRITIVCLLAATLGCATSSDGIATGGSDGASQPTSNGGGLGGTGSGVSSGGSNVGGSSVGGSNAGGSEDGGANTGGLNGDGGTNPGNGGFGGDDGCSDSARLVYVVGQGNELYSFEPPSLTFTQIGVVNCPSGWGSPFAMAVDRELFAWILFDDGYIYKLDIATMQCVQTAYVPGQLDGFWAFGMSFVTDSPGSQDETLFLGSYYGMGIATLDTQTLQLQKVGQYPLYLPVDLTGTGDARLFGFFVNDPLTDPVILAEIDRTDAQLLWQETLSTVTVGTAWALAFWGGDFWLFTCPGQGCSSSQVDRYDPGSQTVTTVATNIGIKVVGASVSTCAPLTAPY